MKIGLLHPEDWAKVYVEYPEAMNFISYLCLHREIEKLEKEEANGFSPSYSYSRKRLAELRELVGGE